MVYLIFISPFVAAGIFYIGWVTGREYEADRRAVSDGRALTLSEQAQYEGLVELNPANPDRIDRRAPLYGLPTLPTRNLDEASIEERVRYYGKRSNN